MQFLILAFYSDGIGEPSIHPVDVDLEIETTKSTIETIANAVGMAQTNGDRLHFYTQDGEFVYEIKLVGDRR